MAGVNTISNTFRTKYTDEFRMDYEIETAQLVQCVNSQGLINGKTVTWDVVDPGEEAVEKGQDGMIPSLQLGLSEVSADLKKWHAPYKIDNFDAFRANPNIRTAASKRGAAAINRKINKLIIEQLDTATNATLSGALSTLAAVSGWMVKLMQRNVPVGDGRTWAIVTPKAWHQLLRIPEFKSADYIQPEAQPTRRGPTYEIRQWLGAKWMINNQLTGAGTADANCYMFHESAIGHMYSGPPRPILFENEEHDYFGVRFEVMQAAKLILQNGVECFSHDDTAALA